MDDLIKRQDVIDALNECNDIKGLAYRLMHDAIMGIPAVEKGMVENETRQ